MKSESERMADGRYRRAKMRARVNIFRKCRHGVLHQFNVRVMDLQGFRWVKHCSRTADSLQNCTEHQPEAAP